MSEDKKQLNLEELEKVAGGLIGKQDGSWKVYDGERGGANGVYYNTLEEAKFAASGICPRCGKTFSDSEIPNHIKAWAAGQK